MEAGGGWKHIVWHGIGPFVMPKENLWAKAREFRRYARTCGDLVVYRALMELADACEELAEQEAVEDARASGQEKGS